MALSGVKSGVQLEVFGDYLVNNGKSERTIKNYMRNIEAFAKWLIEQGGDISNLTRQDMTYNSICNIYKA
ncbi:site-specific integrase [Shimazuella soli]|uniref:site-specific integrase n=1 Tax=Shimazuella soli TaxID=1892854 RepID=UPI001F0E8375|nr:site-specific integrase [Shimazuella soli]